jgi:hypothetical protein
VYKGFREAVWGVCFVRRLVAFEIIKGVLGNMERELRLMIRFSRSRYEAMRM